MKTVLTLTTALLLSVSFGQGVHADEISMETKAKQTQSSDGTMSNAEIRANVEAEKKARADVNGTNNSGITNFKDRRSAADARTDTARGDANTRIQTLGERTNSGTQASATMKIDMH